MVTTAMQVSGPLYIRNFFGQEPEIKEDGGNTTYSVLGSECSVFVNKFTGFNLIHHDPQQAPSDIRERTQALYEAIVVGKQNCSFEINVPKETTLSELMRLVPEDVFTLDDLRKDKKFGQYKLAKWLSEGECMIPPGGTADIGATGLLVDTVSKEVLLVVPKFRKQWEGPGGTAREQEPNVHAAIREVLEETGLKFAILSKDNREEVQVSEDVANEIKITPLTLFSVGVSHGSIMVIM